MRIAFSAGESSGDLHGANLIRALREAVPSVECEGLGGERMAAAGMKLRCDLAERGIMGFAEVVRHFPAIRRIFRDTVAYLKEARPDCFVPIDYPGFNLRLAKEAKALGIPVVYYISPQIWAWHRKRIHAIAECVEKILVILPFEEAIYREAGVDCTYVGHPLLDHIASAQTSNVYADGLVIGLLPGSREQEIRRLMAPMIDVARGILRRYPEARFVTPCVQPVRAEQVKRLAGDFPLETVVGKTYDLLLGARFCMVASGTATLETALFGVPMAILYRVSPITYLLARSLVRIEHIGLVNILAGKTIVPEFIQKDVCTERILPTALELIADTPPRKRMVEDLAAVRLRLGEGGASRRAAAEILRVAERRGHA